MKAIIEVLLPKVWSKGNQIYLWVHLEFTHLVFTGNEPTSLDNNKQSYEYLICECSIVISV